MPHAVATSKGSVARFRSACAKSPKAVVLLSVIVAVGAVGASHEWSRAGGHDLPAIFPVLSQQDAGLLVAALDATPDAVRSADADGNTPLHLAALDGWAEGIEALLARGADANAVNRGGQTPLHLALSAPRSSQLKTVETLLSRGASPTRKAADGRDVAALAKAAGGTDPRVLAAISRPVNTQAAAAAAK
jgi:uncharacterized protein